MKAVGIDVGKAALDVAIHGEPQVRRYANSSAGIGRLLRELEGLGELRIVVEATGGYEEAVLSACAQHGLWIARVNPCQARNFARALGQLAKTDALDAHVLAQMAHALHQRLRAYTAHGLASRIARLVATPSSDHRSDPAHTSAMRNDVACDPRTDTKDIVCVAPRTDVDRSQFAPVVAAARNTGNAFGQGTGSAIPSQRAVAIARTRTAHAPPNRQARRYRAA